MRHQLRPSFLSCSLSHGCTHTYTHTHTYIHTDRHTHTYIHTHTYTQTDIHTQRDTQTNTQQREVFGVAVRVRGGRRPRNAIMIVIYLFVDVVAQRAWMSRAMRVACVSTCRQHSSTCVHGRLHDAELLQLTDTCARAMNDQHIMFATHTATRKTHDQTRATY